MGCCFSTGRSGRNGYDAPTSCRSPPRPPQIEEETVKEVLSETPLNATEPESLTQNEIKVQIFELQEEKITPKIPILKLEEDVSLPEEHDASEYSEMSSVTESFSTATTTTTTMTVSERKEIENEVTSRDYREVAKLRQRVPRSSVKVPRRHSPTMKSAATRPEPPLVRSNRGRELGHSRSTQRNVGRPAGGRRTQNELGGAGSYRRSRSPAAGMGGGRRVGMGERTGGECRKVEENERGETERTKRVLNSDNLKPPPPVDESLDNPLVSLECFIFL